MNRYSWDGLRYFIAAAEAGSLTAAARRLGSNQPTVGRHIDALEEALGVKLFQRSVKGLALTEDGVALLQQGLEIQAQMVRVERTVSGERSVSGSVRLSLPEGLCLEVVLPQLARFYGAYPEIRLQLEVSSSAANLTRGEADLAIRLFRPDEADLVVRQLGEMAMGLFASRGYLERFGMPQGVAELQAHRLIAYGEQLAGLAENRWLLAQAGRVPPVLSSDSTASRLRATLEGVGISLQPRMFLANNPGLIPLLASADLPGHTMWLVYHKDLRQSARVRAVADFLTALLQDQGAGG